MRFVLPLTLGLISILPMQAQATMTTRVLVPSTVRIRPMAAAEYDPAGELTLRGTVLEARAGILKVRLPMGLVRVQVGAPLTNGVVGVGQVIEVIASRWQDEGGQRFIAREVHTAAGTFILRDARGVPVP